ncbi:MAG TPA: hypothetical protein VJQ59_06380 [Candidatus Sulfotelmatobacter sp.]|nr:hypothetical protein [Candidatus Sulfotelmatobacter sp.]
MKILPGTKGNVSHQQRLGATELAKDTPSQCLYASVVKKAEDHKAGLVCPAYRCGTGSLGHITIGEPECRKLVLTFAFTVPSNPLAEFFFSAF